MRGHHRERGRRVLGHGSGGSDLTLAAMVDMMVNLLLFMLTLYGAQAPIAPVGQDLELPPATTLEPLESAVSVSVTRRQLLVDGKPLLTLVDDGGAPALPADAIENGAIPSLRAALEPYAVEARSRASAEGREMRGTLRLEVDRRVPWQALRPIVRTADAAGFSDLRFIVRVVPEGGE